MLFDCILVSFVGEVVEVYSLGVFWIDSSPCQFSDSPIECLFDEALMNSVWSCPTESFKRACKVKYFKQAVKFTSNALLQTLA